MYRWFIRMANRTPFEDNKGRQLVTTAFGIEKESSTTLLAAVGEAGEAIPIELLRFPGFGIRDGEATAYRLNGLVS